ncbi:hypothetical protein HGA91_06330 [candidate division WWE3 bacterium]|nr:hypothetical protein [candidate division WWE3 bacterium]
MKPFLIRLLVICIFSFGLLFTSRSLVKAETVIRIHTVYVNRGVEQATVSWQTDPESKGQVEYADPSGKWTQTPWTNDALSKHSITLFNLIPNTTYVVKINAQGSDQKIITKTDTFTTLNGEVLGAPMSETTPDSASGFQSLLPTATPAPTITNNSGTYYPQVLGQQVVPVVPMYGVPYQMGMQPAVTIIVATPTMAPPTPTPSPSPTMVSMVSELLQSNISNLSLGLVVGVTAAAILHILTSRSPKTQVKPEKKKTHTIIEKLEPKEELAPDEVEESKPPIPEPPKKKKRPTKKFHFSVNS